MSMICPNSDIFGIVLICCLQTLRCSVPTTN
ncbi:hypothetical protein ACHAXS_000952 [Conticribra weissflogii]